jgi:dihydrofolate reductase
VLNVRKVVVYELLSLDGVAEKPDGFFADWDDTMDANLGAVIAAQDSVILGRRSYEEWAEFWPGSDIEPFATFINGVAKYVATSTPLDRKWANTTVVDGELVAFVRDLRNNSAPTSACMQASRSPRHCSPRASSTSSGW